jgi:hypothetical protein
MSAGPLTIDRLERWTLFGARWQVLDLSSRRAVVAFCACTGELVERSATEDPAVIEYLRTAPSE